MLDAGQFGGLLHDVLKQFADSPLADCTDRAALAGGLGDLLDALALEKFAARSLAVVRVQIEQIRLRLAAFATWQADWRSAGWRIQATECDSDRAGLPADCSTASRRICAAGSIASTFTKPTGERSSSTIRAATRPKRPRSRIATRTSGSTCSCRCIGIWPARWASPGRSNWATSCCPRILPTRERQSPSGSPTNCRPPTKKHST